MGLNTEVGGATADSYVTVAEADTYMSQKRRYANIWTAMNTGQKEDSLRQAALEIDYLAVYKGSKYFDVPTLFLQFLGLAHVYESPAAILREIEDAVE